MEEFNTMPVLPRTVRYINDEVGPLIIIHIEEYSSGSLPIHVSIPSWYLQIDTTYCENNFFTLVLASLMFNKK